MSQISLNIAGKTAFDQSGNKVLVNSQGKAFAIDDTIEELWKEIESLLSYSQQRIQGLDELADRVKTGAPEGQVKNVLDKLYEHHLLIFE